MNHPLEGTNGQLMVMAAHRYCLGRSSYIVGSCVDWLIAHKSKFEQNTINVILRDTIDALISSRAGMSCDVDSWTHLCNVWWKDLDEESKRWVRNQTTQPNNERPWPLNSS